MGQNRPGRGSRRRPSSLLQLRPTWDIPVLVVRVGFVGLNKYVELPNFQTKIIILSYF